MAGAAIFSFVEQDPVASALVEAEEAAREAADTALTTAIATEATTARAAEALLAPKASPALTGSPTAPTPGALDNSTKIGTTAYTDAAVAVEATRAAAAEATKATSAALTAETSRATTAEGVNATAITTEATARAAADSSEATARAAADALALQKASNFSDVGNVAAAKANLALVKGDVGLGNVDNTADAGKPVSTAQAAAIAARELGLALTAVKTGTASTAAPSEYSPWDISGGNGVLPLPSAPADRTRVGWKIVAISGTPGSTTLTVNAGAGDAFNVVGGSTSLVFSAKNQSGIAQYDAGSKVWIVQSTDTPLNVALGAAKVGADGVIGTPGQGGTALSPAVVAGSSLGATAIQPNAQGLLDDTMDLRFNLAKSGVIGGVGSASTTAMDHTALIQAYVNACSAAALAVGPMAAAVIDCPNRHYRVQNLTLPANVEMRCNGTRFTYVHASLNPPTGPGNYVLRCYGSYNAIRTAYVAGNGSGQPWIGGVWLMPAGAAASGSARSYQNRVIDCAFDQLGGRSIYDQGVGNHIRVRVAQNCMLSATNISHFMGAIEQAGTDGWLLESEFGPSVTAASNGISVPRCPAIYNASAISTTSGSTTLPLTGGAVTLASTAIASTKGGYVSIGGHLITYTGISGATLTGCWCADTATITTGTSVLPVVGFVAALAVGGANNWSGKNVAEFGDVAVHLGNSTKAHTTATAALTTTANQPVAVDNACHLLTGGGTLGVPTVTGTVVSFPAFTYTSISESTLTGPVTLNQTPQNVAVASTAGWPATGTFWAGGYTVSYTSVVDGLTLGGCTIAAGSAALASGLYVRSNTLNNCSVASGTLAIANNAAISETSGSAGTTMEGNRADFARTHSFVITGGYGALIGCKSISGTQTADNAYDAFHNVAGSSAAFDVIDPREQTVTGLPRHRTGIQDIAQSGTSFCRWIFPRIMSAYKMGASNGFAGGHFTLANSATLTLTANSTTPSVNDLTNAVTANTVPTTITNFTGGVNGQFLSVLIDANTTIANNANIVTQSGAAIAPPSSGFKALKFQFIGSGASPTPAWYQL